MTSTVASDLAPATDRKFFAFVAIVSVAALSFLTWLLVLRTGSGEKSDLAFMPAINASFNATSAVCLTAGYIAIKRKQPKLHRALMIAALTASALFLVSYIVYHYVHGDTKYVGPYRSVYLPLLASHVLLSIPVLPLALTAVWFAATKRFATHKRITRIALPIWLYVSVTGVLVYFFLR